MFFYLYNSCSLTKEHKNVLNIRFRQILGAIRIMGKIQNAANKN